MIIITGAAGFIGSCLVNKLNNKGLRDIVIVDDYSNPLKNKNLEFKIYNEKVHRDDLKDWLAKNHPLVEFIFHIGARTDTTEFDNRIFDRLNLNFTKSLWKQCSEYNIPLIYASSAATYGMGELGYSDDHSLIDRLIPLNPYGESKNNFDKWAILKKEKPPYWVGLKFFNVYGPNEYHKGRMASVIWHAYQQITGTGKMKLFRSHNPDYKDGMQLRDFIYVRDVVDVLYFLMIKRVTPGIYNLGTGQARSFIDLANATFKSMDIPPEIEFIDTPADIRDKYQYFTEAKMEKLRKEGYTEPFYSLEEGIEEYVNEFLVSSRFF